MSDSLNGLVLYNTEIWNVIKQSLNVLPEFSNLNLKQFLHMISPNGLKFESDYKVNKISELSNIWKSFCNYNLKCNPESNILNFVFKISEDITLDLNLYNENNYEKIINKNINNRQVIDISRFNIFDLT